jgi:hypothetical protein
MYCPFVAEYEPPDSLLAIQDLAADSELDEELVEVLVEALDVLDALAVLAVVEAVLALVFCWEL